MTRSKQFPHETVTPFRSRIERLAAKAYHHFPAKEREPRTIFHFATGLLDFRLAEHIVILSSTNP